MIRIVLSAYLLFFFLITVAPHAVALDPPAGAGQSPISRKKLPNEIEKTEDSAYSLKLPVIKTGGALDITLKGAIAAALVNNHDIVIEKITTDISETRIQEEKGVFDPTAKVEVTDSRTHEVDASRASVITNAAKGFGEVSKKFSPGTSLALTYDTTDSQIDSTTGRYQSNLKVSITQDLLKNFGSDITRAKILVAQKGLEQASADYKQKIVETVADVQTAYWDLYKSRETLTVRKKSFELTKGLLSKKNIEARLGAIATIELVEIESDVATKITEYAEALKQVRDDEIKLRALLAMPMDFGSRYSRLRPATSPVFSRLQFDYEQIVADVLSLHQGYQGILREKEAKVIEVAYYRNQILPALQAKASYGLQNQDNNWNTSAKAYDGGNNYEVGLVMTIPIGNREAKAVWRRNVLELKKIEARLKQKEDDIRKEINVALIAVEQAVILVQSGKTNVKIKEKNLNASERKVQFGTSTLRGLLDRQTDLVDAHLRLIQAEIDYQKAVINLYKAQGIIDPELQLEISAAPSQKP